MKKYKPRALHISFNELRRLLTEVGVRQKWRIEYGDGHKLMAWIRSNHPQWNQNRTEGWTLFGCDMYKREYVPADLAILVNEYSGTKLNLEMKPKKQSASD